MYENKPEHEMTDKTELIHQECYEELLAAREEIELLRELVSSQKLLIDSLENELLEAKQEAEFLENKLGRTVMSGVCLNEAKVIAKQALKSEQFGTVLAANLLSDIYNSVVEPIELQESEMLTRRIYKVENKVVNKVIAQSKKIRQNSEILRNRYTELGCQFIIFTARLNTIKQQLDILPPPRKNILLMLKSFKIFDIAIHL